MKRMLSVGLIVLLVAGLLMGCQPSAPPEETDPPATTPAAPVVTEPGTPEGPERVPGDPALALEVPEKPYTIGFSTIYITPIWQQATAALLDENVAEWKAQGLVGE